jgi:membrane fusion protein (multidrug efflux system)
LQSLIAQANHSRNQELVAQKLVSQRSLDESAANPGRPGQTFPAATAARLKIAAPFDGTYLVGQCRRLSQDGATL